MVLPINRRQSPSRERENVRQVELGLGILRSEEGERLLEKSSIERIGARVDLGNLLLVTRRIFLFDYLHDQISGDELKAFHNFQTDRLDKGIRNYLSSRNLLEGLNFRVKRCSATTVKDASRATQAATVLKVPAVLWGFIKRADNKLISATTITMLDGQPMNLGTREVLGNDVTELIGLDRPVMGTPLAMAALVVGDIHLKQGRADLARRAFLDALELAKELDPRDKVEFMQAVNVRLQRLDD